ncbi:MAG: hypothetical protein IPI17_02480 [Nitrosomonas sp.]|nr:hypothetical protein [Nitrosomonas sp.]
MAFADYTDGVNAVKAVLWDWSDSVAEEVIYQIPGISVHLNTVGETQIKELRFNDYLIVPEGDWVIIFVAENSVQASRMTDSDFIATYTSI